MSKDDKPTKLEPHLRFPEFKGGPGWDTPAMSDLYGFRSTNSLSRDQLNYDSGSIYNIHYGDIHTKFQTQFRLDSERVPFIDPTVAEELGDRFHLCREGDIILADASEDLNDVGKAIELIALDAHRVVAGTHTIHATRIGDNPVIGFGGYLFKSAAVRRGIHKEAQGAKVYGISSTRIAAVRLPLPHTTAEQRKIAECLGSLDGWIAAETDALAALRRHKTGLMQHLFPRPGETRPRLRFPEFRESGAWSPTALEDVLDYEQPTPYIVESDNYREDGTPVLTANKSFVLGYTDERIGIYDNIPAVIFDDFTTDAKFVNFPFKVKSSAIKILTKKRTDDELPLIFELLRRIPFDPIQHKRYYISEYQYLTIPLPDPAEQRKIAECLGSLDDWIGAETDALAALLRHKRGLMQQLFPAPDAADGGG